MKLVLKRVGAYLIDIILVSIIATFLSSNKYINKDYEKYTNIYNEYMEKYESYNEYYEELENLYKDKEITQKEYNKLLTYSEEYIKELINSYEDKKITEEEYENILNKSNEEYSKMETNYSYKLLNCSIITTIISLMCILLYFVVIQFYFDGKTLGKKIMKLKVVSNNDKELGTFNYLIRSLIVNEVFINIINIILLIVLSKNNFLAYNKIIYVITYILEMAILFMIVFDKNNRGLHDYISNTKVIEDKKE